MEISCWRTINTSNVNSVIIYKLSGKILLERRKITYCGPEKWRVQISASSDDISSHADACSVSFSLGAEKSCPYLEKALDSQ